MNFCTRMQVLGHSMLAIPFSSALSTYSAPQLQAFYDAITIQGLSVSTIQNSDTLRQALAVLVAQYDGIPVTYVPWTMSMPDVVKDVLG